MLVQIVTDAITDRLDHAAYAAVLAREARIRAEPADTLGRLLDDTDNQGATRNERRAAPDAGTGDCAITVLHARGRRLAKLIHPDGSIIGYDDASTSMPSRSSSATSTTSPTSCARCCRAGIAASSEAA